MIDLTGVEMLHERTGSKIQRNYDSDLLFSSLLVLADGMSTSDG